MSIVYVLESLGMKDAWMCDYVQWFCSQQNLDKDAKQISHNTSRRKELILVGSFLFATAGIHQLVMHCKKCQGFFNLISVISVACLLSTPIPQHAVDGHTPMQTEEALLNDEAKRALCNLPVCDKLACWTEELSTADLSFGHLSYIFLVCVWHIKFKKCLQFVSSEASLFC